MPFKDPEKSVRHILKAIELIERFIGGLTFDSFREDPKTISAVERQLQIISEAAIRLGVEAEQRGVEIEWPEIRGMGNWLRRAYDAVELPILWNTVEGDPPKLKSAVLAALRAAPQAG